MKFFDRTGGHWLFWTGFCYLIGGLAVANSENKAYTLVVELVWLITMSAPLWCPPFGRYLNMRVDWDKAMLNWFGKKSKDDGKVVKFPERKPSASSEPPAPPRPADPPKEKEEPAKIYYRLGLTDNNRVAFSMGYSEITMNATGCQQMIDQLKFFQSQLTDEDDGGGGNDPDGGEPVPVPEQKAA
jgi:hypothetical protein